MGATICASTCPGAVVDKLELDRSAEVQPVKAQQFNDDPKTGARATPMAGATVQQSEATKVVPVFGELTARTEQSLVPLMTQASFEEKPTEKRGMRFAEEAEVNEIEAVKNEDTSRRSHPLRSKSMRVQSADRLPTFIDPNHGLRSLKSVIDSGGSVADSYTVQNKLGEGAFGVVCRVKHNKSGKLYAMKTIPVQNVENPEAFERELMIARQLKQPYIVSLQATYNDPHSYHLIMELCTGGDLLDKIASTCLSFAGNAKGGLDTPTVAQYLWQMLNGIAYCHGYRFAHRDIKPENYLLSDMTANHTLKLIDFGLARSFNEGEMLKSKVGTAAYVAPEVMTSQKGYDQRCDVWSIGITAYVMAVAQQPFVGETEEDILRKVIHTGALTFKGAGWDKHSAELKDLILLLTTKDVSQRPQAKAILESNEWLKNRSSKPSATTCCSLQ